MIRSFETETECQRAATNKRATRNVIVLRGRAAIEVVACLPDNADPTLAGDAHASGPGVGEVRLIFVAAGWLLLTWLD